MKEKIYIFGHKKPDTDSVCAAISLSYLKNMTGLNTEPRILSAINEETKFVLKKFKFKTPEELHDVKLQVCDIDYHKDFSINIKESVFKAFFVMQNNNMSTIPLVDDNNKFVGTFAMKDIAKTQLLKNNTNLKTKYDHIIDAVDGIKTLKFDDEIIGNIINISLRSSNELVKNIFDKDSILIIGDRHSIIENAINKKVKLIILTSNAKLKEEHLKLAKQNKINIIYTENTTVDTLIKLGYSNYIENFFYTKDLICVDESMDVTDLNDLINNTKHSYYPVIDNSGKCLGLIKLADIRQNNPKKVMLVDHNESAQSVEGLDEAEIMSIVDHHKLGNIGTNKPINFRNMTVGSTCTIIYELFKEEKIKIPENIAGLLLSGIISDTLYLKSPTTTDNDISAVKKLSALTNIDAEKYALEMFKAGDTIKSKTMKEIVYTDFKVFNVDKKTIAVAQVTTLNSKAILKQMNSYIRFLNKESKANLYDVMIFSITDIFKNGSYIIFNEGAKSIMKMAFNEKLEQGDFLEGVVSRKKQILPPIINCLQ